MDHDTRRHFIGRVAFVGAGPGNPDLLTLRAARWLRQADVVVHDALVPRELLVAVGPATELVPVPRDGADPGEAAGHLVVQLAREGRTVVRLKGGDPAVFARMAEELRPLEEAGIPYEIVPGVTAALAAAAAAGIPLTSRAAASAVCLVTGHEADEKRSAIDFTALAAVPGTLAIYMGVEQVDKWSRGLLAAGKPGDTPVTIVSRCSWPDEQIAVTTLAECVADAQRQHWRSPAVAIVGAVARAAPPAPSSWQPLAGRRVLIPRPAGQGEEIAERIAEQGGTSVHIPAIRIAPPPSWDALDDALNHADTFDWIVFSSVHGVEAFLGRLAALSRDGRSLGSARLAAVGPATARALTAAGYACDCVPADFRAEGLVAALGGMGRGMRFLLCRADRGRDVLKRGLEAAGHHVTDVVAYRSMPVASLPEPMADLIATAPIDWITVTSPSVAEACHGLFGTRLADWRIASISPLTSAALDRLGLHTTAEAREATAAGIVAAMAAWELAHAAESSCRAGSLPADDR